ncbi:transcriptional regulator, partial [Rhizobium leguminosarum]|nr:transcriptional regulator [Rhizobium ruizarguesonis]
RWIERNAGGEAAVAAFARDRIEAQAGAYREAVESAEPDRRTEALAKALTADGYAATARNAPVGEQLCQHHCPVSAVAARHPEICEAEHEAISELVGKHVQPLAMIADGDGICTTNIPLVAVGKTAAARE